MEKKIQQPMILNSLPKRTTTWKAQSHPAAAYFLPLPIQPI